MDLKYTSSFTLFLSGLALFTSHLFGLKVGNDVNLAILWIGVLLLSFGLVLIILQKHEKTFLFALLLSAFSILTWEQIRFGRIEGTDIMVEIEAANYTAYRGWTSDLMTARIGTTLSVTILPAIISKVTGMSILNIFETVFMIVSALSPLILYILIKHLSNSMIVAGLSSVIFTFDYEKLSLGPNAIRENIAKILLIITLYVLYKRHNLKHSEKNGRMLIVVSLLAIAGVVISHYTVSLFLLGLFILLKLFSLIESREISLWFLGRTQKSHHPLLLTSLISFAFVVTLSYMIFISFPMFELIIKIVYETALQIFGIKPPDFHPYIMYTLTFPRAGLFSLAILWIYRFLILLGLPLCLKKYKDSNTRTFIFLGIFMLFMLGTWVLVPHISRELQIDRVYSFGLPFFSFFLASSIVGMTVYVRQAVTSWAKLSKLKFVLCHGFKYILPCFFISLFFLNHISILPSFYYLPTRASPREELMVAPFHTKNDIELCEWINYRTRADATFLGDVRSREILSWLAYSPSVLPSPEYGLGYVVSNESFSSGPTGFYISLLDYVFKEDSIVEIDIVADRIPNSKIARTPSQRVIVFYPKLKNAVFNPGINLIYGNGQNYLFYTNLTWDLRK